MGLGKGMADVGASVMSMCMALHRNQGVIYMQVRPFQFVV